MIGWLRVRLITCQAKLPYGFGRGVHVCGRRRHVAGVHVCLRCGVTW